MNSKDFLRNLDDVEQYVFNHADGFGNHGGFLGALKQIETKNLLPEEILRDLTYVWKVRNQIVHAHANSSNIPPEASNVMARLQTIVRDEKYI